MSQNQSVELSAFSSNIMQGRNLIYCQIANKAGGNREETNLYEHEQYYLIVYKMMEAHNEREGSPQRLRVYCDKQQEGRKDDSIREKENRTSSTIYIYTHMDKRGKRRELLKH